MTTITPLPGLQNPWEHPLTAGSPPPVSERLVRALVAHIAAESYDAARASRLADTSGDRAVNVLLELIVNAPASLFELVATAPVPPYREIVDAANSWNAAPLLALAVVVFELTAGLVILWRGWLVRMALFAAGAWGLGDAARNTALRIADRYRVDRSTRSGGLDPRPPQLYRERVQADEGGAARLAT
jgi:hypothetical protein